MLDNRGNDSLSNQLFWSAGLVTMQDLWPESMLSLSLVTAITTSLLVETSGWSQQRSQPVVGGPNPLPPYFGSFAEYLGGGSACILSSVSAQVVEGGH